MPDTRPIEATCLGLSTDNKSLSFRLIDGRRIFLDKGTRRSWGGAVPRGGHIYTLHQDAAEPKAYFTALTEYVGPHPDLELRQRIAMSDKAVRMNARVARLEEEWKQSLRPIVRAYAEQPSMRANIIAAVVQHITAEGGSLL